MKQTQKRSSASVRSPSRIAPFLRTVEAVWMENPDMRFGQLLANVAGHEDTWEWENSRWFEAIDAWRNQSEATLGDKPCGEKGAAP